MKSWVSRKLDKTFNFWFLEETWALPASKAAGDTHTPVSVQKELVIYINGFSTFFKNLSWRKSLSWKPANYTALFESIFPPRPLGSTTCPACHQHWQLATFVFNLQSPTITHGKRICISFKAQIESWQHVFFLKVKEKCEFIPLW